MQDVGLEEKTFDKILDAFKTTDDFDFDGTVIWKFERGKMTPSVDRLDTF
jgi:hypothetical protein